MDGLTVSGIGRIGTTPEMRYCDDEHATPMITFRLAVRGRPDRRQDEQQQNDSWYSVAIFGRTAEFVNEYFNKGDPIHFTGQLNLRDHTRRDGTQTMIANIKVNDVGFVPTTRRPDGAQANNTNEATNQE